MNSKLPSNDRIFRILLTAIVSVSFGTLAMACKKDAAVSKPAGFDPGTEPAAKAPSAAAQPSAPPAPEAVPAPVPESESVSGKISVKKALAAKVKKGDVIFLIVRKAGGPPGPMSMLAVQKHEVTDFPMPFSLSGRDAMIPGVKFEGKVNISIRVDKDGDAMSRKKGDITGEVKGVSVGSKDVELVLDTELVKDVILGRRPMGGAHPGGAAPRMRPGQGRQGMPAGHP